MSTLFVGIDVSSKSNVVYNMDFDKNNYISSFNVIVIVLETSSVCSIHISNFLSNYEVLIHYKPYVYCVNLNMTANYHKTYVDMNTFLVADFTRSGHTQM